MFALDLQEMPTSDELGAKIDQRCPALVGGHGPARAHSLCFLLLTSRDS